MLPRISFLSLPFSILWRLDSFYCQLLSLRITGWFNIKKSLHFLFPLISNSGARTWFLIDYLCQMRRFRWFPFLYNLHFLAASYTDDFWFTLPFSYAKIAISFGHIIMTFSLLYSISHTWCLHSIASYYTLYITLLTHLVLLLSPTLYSSRSINIASCVMDVGLFLLAFSFSRAFPRDFVMANKDDIINYFLAATIFIYSSFRLHYRIYLAVIMMSCAR